MFNTSDPELYSEDAKARTRKGSAYELLASRLDQNFWPLYSRTWRSRHITSGAQLAFYVGGTKQWCRHIVALSTVKRVIPADRCLSFNDDEKFLTDLPSRIVELHSTEYLRQPIDFKHMLPKLSLCPKNSQYWGVIIQGGVTKIPESDWHILFS